MKSIYYIFILTLSLLCASCSDFLTEEPISDLTAESFWKTDKDAEVGIVAIYSAFSKAISPGMWDWGELRADNYIPHDKDAFDQKELIYNNIQIDNQAALWTNLYSVISRANAAIKYIPRITMTPKKKNNLQAEAYALRAWAYFYCVRVWGDVPLYTEPIEEISQGIYRDRTDKNIIFQEVILPDLEKAYYLIDKTSTVRTRINVATICALTMDVNAWLHDYEKVVSTMKEKVQTLNKRNWGLSALTPETFAKDWRAIFIEDNQTETPIEVIFKLAYDQLGNGENQSINYFASSQPRVFLSDKIKGLYGILDKRFGSTQWEDIGEGKTQLKKKFWPDGTIFVGTGRVYSDNDLVLYRYADIVLLYAEALNALDRTPEAITELNRTRTRSGENPFYTSDFVSSNEILDAILEERQKEFVGEGKRWFDLVRCNRWKEVMEPINGMNDERKVLFPIHRDHINQNLNLKQNSSY
jgi:hypothetical protein